MLGAIFAGRRLILVPWERGIEPESDPFDPAPRPDGKERPVVFDIWEDGAVVEAPIVPNHFEIPRLAEDIGEVVSMWTGIPVARIASEESARLLRMEQSLRGSGFRRALVCAVSGPAAMAAGTAGTALAATEVTAAPRAPRHSL